VSRDAIRPTLDRATGALSTLLALDVLRLCSLTCSCENTSPPLPCPCSSIPTCYATLAASPWPIKARILGSFRITSDIGTFSTPSSTRPPTQHGSKSCGDEPTHVHMPSRQHDCMIREKTAMALIVAIVSLKRVIGNLCQSW
jgi:hypothetical protein